MWEHTQKMETCQSGRLGLPAKELNVSKRSVGSNPTVSAMYLYIPSCYAGIGNKALNLGGVGSIPTEGANSRNPLTRKPNSVRGFLYSATIDQG